MATKENNSNMLKNLCFTYKTYATNVIIFLNKKDGFVFFYLKPLVFDRVIVDIVGHFHNKCMFLRILKQIVNII